MARITLDQLAGTPATVELDLYIDDEPRGIEDVEIRGAVGGDIDVSAQVEAAGTCPQNLVLHLGVLRRLQLPLQVAVLNCQNSEVETAEVGEHAGPLDRPGFRLPCSATFSNPPVRLV